MTVVVIVASMRPRPDGRGNPPLRILCGVSASRFNEAATRWSRKWGKESRRVLQGWKASMRPRPDGRGNELALAMVYGAGSASMMPRPDGRGNPESRGLLVH